MIEAPAIHAAVDRQGRATCRALYRAADGRIGTLDEPRLVDTTERHLVALPPPSLSAGDAVAALEQDSALGLVVELSSGVPATAQLALVERALALGRRAWLFWPDEGAVECATAERLASYRRLARVASFYRTVGEPLLWIAAAPRRLVYAMRSMPPRQVPGWMVRRAARVFRRFVPSQRKQDGQHDGGMAPGAAPMVRHARRLGALREARRRARSVPFTGFPSAPDPEHRIQGCGVYLRTDFWAPIVSGGSYGHTCYVAKELAAVTEAFVCFMANPFPLLDEYGLEQVVMPHPAETYNEDDIASATPHFLELLRPAFEDLRPAYIYERLCLGNSAGAQLSAEFGVPYIVEYNGSEISMRRSFEGTGYVYEAEYLEAEALAFEQATIISVVSAEIRNSLVARGVDPAKILVNPNGVDLSAYAPAAPQEREAIRASVGFSRDDRVVGFTGTFGGWHGIDVLADAIPTICREDSRVRFLLIGDGNFKRLVDEAVRSSRLESRVVSTGRVPQVEGARLLKACDIYVSPHSAHMIDSKFFGSPTKLFEYMALGGGIVASDLEQIGQVLSPALSADDAKRGVAVTDERAVLCEPGDVDEFVDAVLALVRDPERASALGRNARRAAEDYYSWTRHVANVWRFASGGSMPSEIVPDLRRKRSRGAAAAGESDSRLGTLIPPAHAVETGDGHKEQVQRQWNNDPAGSHYVTAASPHTLEWFLEAERYRYGVYAPWMPEVMEFDRHAGDRVLEIGGGMGTDLVQFAQHGALVTDADLSAGHLKLAKENFALRGLTGEFIQRDAESLDFADASFDLVYSNGVIHHTPNTRRVVDQIYRVLKPGGRAIVMVYAEDSLHYWRNLVWNIGFREGQLARYSIGEIMSRTVERSDNAAAHPLVKVYTDAGVRAMFDRFVDVDVTQHQLDASAVPRVLGFVPRRGLAGAMGWNLVVKARKPNS